MFLQDSERHNEAERWLRQAVELSKLASISPYELYSGRVALAETLESLEQFDAAVLLQFSE